MSGQRLLAVVVASATSWLCPHASEAQQRTSRSSVIAGVTLSGLRTAHPEGGIAAAGVLLGLERVLSDAFSLRAVASLTRGVFSLSPDDIALCHRAGGGCLPDAVFPTWMSGLSLEGSLAPRRGWPIRIVGGLGAIVAGDPRENQRTRGAVDASAVLRATWRVGFEIPLGSSAKAPFVQISRAGFTATPFSVSSIDAIALSLRR